MMKEISQMADGFDEIWVQRNHENTVILCSNQSPPKVTFVRETIYHVKFYATTLFQLALTPNMILTITKSQPYPKH